MQLAKLIELVWLKVESTAGHTFTPRVDNRATIGLWWSLGGGGHWALVVIGLWWSLGSGRHWDLVVIGLWQSLGSGGHWALVVIGLWWSLGFPGHLMSIVNWTAKLLFTARNTWLILYDVAADLVSSFSKPVPLFRCHASRCHTLASSHVAQVGKKRKLRLQDRNIWRVIVI